MTFTMPDEENTQSTPAPLCISRGRHILQQDDYCPRVRSRVHIQHALQIPS